MSKKLYIPSQKYRQLNAPFCDKTSFNYTSLKALAARYKAHAPPDFLVKLISNDVRSPETQLYRKYPKLYYAPEDQDFIIITNFPYFDAKAFAQDSNTYKFRDGGVTITAWYVHPNLKRFALHEIHADQKGHNNVNELTIKDIEDIANVAATRLPYLASIFDLNSTHVPWLKGVYDALQTYAKSVFGADNKDTVRLYVHNLIHPKSATLHFHMTINQGLHPKELEEIIWFDTLIEELEKNASSYEIALQSTGGQFHYVHFGNERTFLHSLPAATTAFNQINPYITRRRQEVEAPRKPTPLLRVAR